MITILVLFAASAIDLATAKTVERSAAPVSLCGVPTAMNTKSLAWMPFCKSVVN